jgi:hypothetical protein
MVLSQHRVISDCFKQNNMGENAGATFEVWTYLRRIWEERPGEFKMEASK